MLFFINENNNSLSCILSIIIQQRPSVLKLLISFSAESKKIIFQQYTRNSDNLCARTKYVLDRKKHMEILKLSQKHTSHKLLWRPIVLLKERKRGNS